MIHPLQLYPKVTNLLAPLPPPAPVLSQYYDELIFTDPYPSLFSILSSSRLLKRTPFRDFNAQSEAEEVAKLEASCLVVGDQVRVYKEKLAEKQAELDELKLVRKEGGEGGTAETPEPMIVM
jgi:hypothetical protein